MDASNMKALFEGMTSDLVAQAQELGRELKVGAQELAMYAEDRANHLAGFVGQPGYAEAVQAELDNVLLKAGLKAADAGDAADAKLAGFVQGTLNFAARLLSIVVV